MYVRYPTLSLQSFRGLPLLNQKMPRRVLIADDDPRIRSLVQSQIEQLPAFEVCAAVANGTEAVEAAIALRPDVLVLDVLMPGLNGIEVAGVLKNSLPAAKIILFTLPADAMSRHMKTALGVTLVSKADGLRALRRALQEFLETRAREVDERLARAIRNGKMNPADLELLTRQFSAPLSRCGRDLKYLWVNEHYASFLKLPVEKIAGRSILDTLGKSAFDALGKYFDQALRGKLVSYDLEVQFKSVGRRRVTASYKPTFDNSGSPDGWLAYVEDITPRPSHASDLQSSTATPRVVTPS